MGITVRTGEYTVGAPPTRTLDTGVTVTLHYFEHAPGHSIGLRGDDGRHVVLDTNLDVVSSGGCTAAEIESLRAKADTVLRRHEIVGHWWPRE